MENELNQLVGKGVTVETVNYEDEPGPRFRMSVNGTLEAKCEDEGEYLARVKECYNGTSCVSFAAKHVERIDYNPSGRVTIVLKN